MKQNKERSGPPWVFLLGIAAGMIWQSLPIGVIECAAAADRKPRPSRFELPMLIELTGDLNWRQSKFIRSKIEWARQAGVDLIVVEIDSESGLSSECLNLGELFGEIDWAYTVAFVPKRATGAAALIPLGCDAVVVGKLSRIGDVGSIRDGPPLFGIRFAQQSSPADLAAKLQDLAASKGRSTELARAFTEAQFAVYQRNGTDKLEFRGSDSDQELGRTWSLVPETGKSPMLLNGTRAVSLGIAQGIADDRQSLASAFGFELAEVVLAKPTVTDAAVYYLNHPLGMSMLILIGCAALIGEIGAPGIGLGGLIAGLSAVLFFWSRMLGGTSTWLEVILFVAGVVFLLIELLVIPGFGLPGVTGIVLMVVSLFLASQDFVIPSDSRQWNQFLTSLLTVMCAGMLTILFLGFALRNLNQIPVFGKLMLPPPAEALDSDTNRKSGFVPHPPIGVGDWGRAESLLRPAGRARFAGRSFDVVSDGEFIEPGTQIRVLEIHGNRIVVTAVSESADATS